MKKLYCGFFALLLTATMSASAATAMTAGFAKSKITPPVGTPMTGFGNRDYDPSGSRAVHDDLFARALYLADGKERVLIMGFDLLFFSRDRFVLLKDRQNIMALIPSARNGFSLRPGKHAVLAAEKNASFRWVPYVGTVTKAADDGAMISTLILPVGNDGEARKIGESLRESTGSDGSLTISFRYKGNTYRYRFIRGADGLVLEEGNR